MITKKQKFSFSIISLIATIFAIIAIVPFEMIEKSDQPIEKLDAIESIIKIIVMPLLTYAMCLYGMMIRRDNHYRQINVSISSIKMSYVPMVIYMIGLLSWFVGKLYLSNAMTNSVNILLGFIGSIGGALFLSLAFGVFTQWLNKINALTCAVINNLFIIVSAVVVFFVYKTYSSLDITNSLSNEIILVEFVSAMFLIVIVLLSAWKAIFGNDKTPVVLRDDEIFTPEERDTFVSLCVNEDMTIKFNEYYSKNKGMFLEKYKGNMEGENNEE